MDVRNLPVRGTLYTRTSIPSENFELNVAWIVKDFVQHHFTSDTSFRSDFFSCSALKESKFCMNVLQKNVKYSIHLHEESLNAESDDKRNYDSTIHPSISVIHQNGYIKLMKDVFGDFPLCYDSRYELIVLCRLSSIDNFNEEKSSSVIVASSSDPIKYLHFLFDRDRVFDVTIEVGTKEFRAHQAVLTARSPVFLAMFEHNTIEKQSKRITIKDFTSEAISQLLLYMYGGEIRLNGEMALCLLRAADKYDIPQLKEQCIIYLCANMTTINLLSVLFLAHEIQDKHLEEICTEFFTKNATDVMFQEEWLTFLKRYPEWANTMMICVITDIKKQIGK